MAGAQKRYIVDGYAFASKQDYEQAKKESESVAFIRSELDIAKPEQVLAVYRRVTAKGEFRTPVGLGFLRDLQHYLVKKKETKGGLPPIPVPEGHRTVESQMTAQEDEGEQGNFSEQSIQNIKKELEVSYRRKFWRMRIVSGFLLLLVIVLFVVTWKDQNPDLEAEREAVLDEYASWKEDLTQWEAELEEREAAIRP